MKGQSYRQAAPIVIIEDVVTTGASALQAVERLRQAGYEVNDILALVDRQQGGQALYQSEGLNFRPIFTIAELQTHWRAQQ